ncbi:MAG: hemolysin family protein [Proteobacteria bacterium]|nr:hemolysin family protein [Pseudomonadota bacterium]
MFDLILAVGLAVGISAFCSVAEAVLYSVTWSRIEQLRESGRTSGNILFALRTNVEKPIAAILSLNTIANTAGAAIAGAAAVRVFGQAYMGVFAAAFTMLILVFSEILPKTVGVMYARSLAPALARPLEGLVWILSPIIWLLGLMSGLVPRRAKGPRHTEADISTLATLTRRAGVLKPFEEACIKGILALDEKVVSEIMTPRTVVFSLPAEVTVGNTRAEKSVWPYSRVPVYEDGNPEDIVGVVYRRQVLQALAEDKDDLRIAELMKPVKFVLDSLPLDKLLISFLESRMHLAVVLDEWGGLAGVVSLEDVLEEILDKEIVDETDEFVDTRAQARTQREQLVRGTKKPQGIMDDEE